ncbi:MAG: hypothetical protein WD359_03780 [Dehalococcoidia bacterium]
MPLRLGAERLHFCRLGRRFDAVPVVGDVQFDVLDRRALNRDEDVRRAEHAAFDLDPLRLRRVVVVEDLVDLADLLAVHVNHGLAAQR